LVEGLFLVCRRLSFAISSYEREGGREGEREREREREIYGH
jgi:hypothetical protein